MGRNQRIPGTAVLVAALFMSLFVGGTARAQAQSSAYVGKFTLTSQTHWGNSVLQPGNYTITIESTGEPIIGLIRNADGDAVTHVVSGARCADKSGANVLVIREKDGQLKVQSLALADLGMILIYDPTLTRKTVQEVRFSQKVPMMWAKK
jgi:hypothetical protein